MAARWSIPMSIFVSVLWGGVASWLATLRYSHKIMLATSPSGVQVRLNGSDWQSIRTAEMSNKIIFRQIEIQTDQGELIRSHYFCSRGFEDLLRFLVTHNLLAIHSTEELIFSQRRRLKYWAIMTVANGLLIGGLFMHAGRIF